MVFLASLLILLVIIYVIEFNVPKLEKNLARGARLFMAFLRELIWDPYYSTSILMTYFYSLRILLWLIMPMAVPPIDLVVLLMRLF